MPDLVEHPANAPFVCAGLAHAPPEPWQRSRQAMPGRPVPVDVIRVPPFAAGTETGDLAPWRSIHGLYLLNGRDLNPHAGLWGPQPRCGQHAGPTTPALPRAAGLASGDPRPINDDP